MWRRRLQKLCPCIVTSAAGYPALSQWGAAHSPKTAAFCNTGEELGSLAPVDSDLEPPPSDCPLILCKTRDAAAAACAVFDQGGEHMAFPASGRGMLVYSWSGKGVYG